MKIFTLYKYGFAFLIILMSCQQHNKNSTITNEFINVDSLKTLEFINIALSITDL